MRTITHTNMAALCFVLSACGGGSDSSPPPPSATPIITSYMIDAYSSDQTALTSDEQALLRSLAANGQLCGGAMYIDLTNLKISHVQAFVANALSAVQADRDLGYGIDKAAITSLFDSYQTQDLAWLDSYTWANCGISQGILGQLETTFTPAVNSAYSAAVTQINSM